MTSFLSLSDLSDNIAHNAFEKVVLRVPVRRPVELFLELV